MSTLFTNSDLGNPSDAHRLKINLADRINLGRGIKYVVLSDYTWKNNKTTTAISLKYKGWYGMKILH